MRGITISRVVAFMTPVFAGAAGWVTAWSAEHLPGAPQLDEGELTTFFAVGAATAAGAAVTWLNNRAKHERQQALLDREQAQRDEIIATTGMLPESLQPSLPAGLEADVSRAVHGLRGFDERLEQIETLLAQRAGVPPVPPPPRV